MFTYRLVVRRLRGRLRGRERDDAAVETARAVLAARDQVLLALRGGRLPPAGADWRARETLPAGVELAVEEERVAARDEATVKAVPRAHSVLNHTKEVLSVMRPVDCTMIFTSGPVGTPPPAAGCPPPSPRSAPRPSTSPGRCGARAPPSRWLPAPCRTPSSGQAAEPRERSGS